MFEFITLEAPLFAPNQCLGCGSGAGPVVDTHRELPGYGRVYLCLLCVKRSASVFGIIEGDRMEELLDADTALRRRSQELASVNVRVAALDRQVENATRRYEVAEEDLAIALGRVKQLEERLADKARADLDLVQQAV